MDDLAGKISEILNDPASMEKIRNLSSMLGVGQDTAPAQSQPAPQSSTPQTPQNSLSGLLGSLGSLGGSGNSGGAGGLGGLGGLSGLGGLGGAAAGINPELLQSVIKIAPLLSSVNQEDDSMRLLHALRPFLKPERQKKLDESANMMRMFKLLPLLKGSGFLSSIFG